MEQQEQEQPAWRSAPYSAGQTLGVIDRRNPHSVVITLTRHFSHAIRGVGEIGFSGVLSILRLEL